MKNNLDPSVESGYFPQAMSNVAKESGVSPEAHAALQAFYNEFGQSQTVPQKIKIMQGVLGESSFYAADGDVTDEIKLACLEYEWLGFKGLVELDLV